MGSELVTRERGPVFLLDVDNTLIDHDALKVRVSDWISQRPEGQDPELFWKVYEGVREATGIVDFLEAARQFGVSSGSEELGAQLRRFLWEFPFPDLMFLGVMPTIEGLKARGRVVILCDGHEPFQTRKVSALGIGPHLDGLLVFDHKESHIDEVIERFPADHYVLIDDKPRIHESVKQRLGGLVTTVQVEHGHYARAQQPGLFRPDFLVKTFSEVGDLAPLLFVER